MVRNLNSIYDQTAAVAESGTEMEKRLAETNEIGVASHLVVEGLEREIPLIR